MPKTESTLKSQVRKGALLGAAAGTGKGLAFSYKHRQAIRDAITEASEVVPAGFTRRAHKAIVTSGAATYLLGKPALQLAAAGAAAGAGVHLYRKHREKTADLNLLTGVGIPIAIAAGAYAGRKVGGGVSQRAGKTRKAGRQAGLVGGAIGGAAGLALRRGNSSKIEHQMTRLLTTVEPHVGMINAFKVRGTARQLVTPAVGVLGGLAGGYMASKIMAARKKSRTKTASEEKTPFLKRRSTRIGLGIAGGALVGAGAGYALRKPIQNIVGTHLQKSRNLDVAGPVAHYTRLAELSQRARRVMNDAVPGYGSQLDMSHAQHAALDGKLSILKGRHEKLHAAAEAAKEHFIENSQAYSRTRAKHFRRVGKGLVGAGAVLGSLAGGAAAKSQHDKTASIHVPAGTRVAILPRDLTRFMSDDDAALVKKRAPHRRYDQGVLVRGISRGAVAYATRVGARMKAQKEDLAHAARYTAEDVQHGLTDFFTSPTLTPAQAFDASSKMAPAMLPLATGVNEGAKRAFKPDAGRDQTARRAVRAVSSAQFWDGAVSGQPLRSLLVDGRKSRRQALVGIGQTPAGQPVVVTV